MIDIEEIARRLFGDDIYYARDGIGSIECATATTNDLNAVNHARRQLFQTIDGSQRREDWARVHEDLGVLPLQTVDANLWNTAVGAGLLYAQTCLEIEHICHGVGGGGFDDKRRYDIDDSRHFFLFGFVLVGSNNHIVNHKRCFCDFHIHLDEGVAVQLNGAFFRFVSNHGEDDSEFAFGEVLEVEVSRFIGKATEGSAFDLYINKRKMLSGVRI